MRTARPHIPVSPTELLGLILGCAATSSASFTQALHTVSSAVDGDPEHQLTRELLTDLTIRDWIVLVRDDDGAEEPVARSRYEMELAAAGNWDETEADRARFALTAKGRERMGPLLSTLNGRRDEPTG